MKKTTNISKIDAVKLLQFLKTDTTVLQNKGFGYNKRSPDIDLFSFFITFPTEFFVSAITHFGIKSLSWTSLIANGLAYEVSLVILSFLLFHFHCGTRFCIFQCFPYNILHSFLLQSIQVEVNSLRYIYISTQSFENGVHVNCTVNFKFCWI